MRILLVSTYPPDRCGIAAYAVQVASSLRRQGHEVRVISPRPSAAADWADYSRTLLGVLRVLALSLRADRTIVQMFPDLLFQHSGRMPFLRKWSFLRQCVAVALLFRLGRRVELVVHEAPYRSLVGRRDPRGRIGRAMWRILVTLPHRTFVHTPWERQQLAAATGADPRRIGLLDHGEAFRPRTHADRELARRELGLPDGFHFLSIGYLQPHKGFDRAMRALATLNASSRIWLHVVGSVRVRSTDVLAHLEELRRLAAGIPGVVLHEEYVSDAAFDRWIVASDAVVLPYRDIWSSGVMERAKLYGRRMIVSDIGGLRDQADAATRVVRDDEELRRAMAELAGVATADTVREAGGDGRSEALPYGEAAALVRRRADELRSSVEPDAVTGRDGQGWPALSLPAPPLGSRPRALVKRAAVKLVRWQLTPIVGRVNELTARLDDLEEGPRDRPHQAPVARPGADDGVGAGWTPSLAALYEAHQARFGGDREPARVQHEMYLRSVRAVASDDAPVLDVGPGRGEWLRVLREHGIRAYGVDVDHRFVEAARELGLEVHLGDGLAHLRRLPDGSLSAVTALHVVEHLPPEGLLDLVDQSLRVLRPGGIVILETPNPVNLAVTAADFPDAPHRMRPLHPLYLEFVLENRGFTRIRTIPVHPPDEPPLEVRPEDHETLRRAAELINRHFFTGRDYAVLASRPEAADDGRRRLAADRVVAR